MHLPDGFLDAKTALITTGAAVAGVSIALRQARISTEQRRKPLLGLAAAFIFAAQMINFPVVGGTSGHLVGGVLTAILLGPSAAILVMTCVLLVQCLLFADGGVTTLGANIFNMGIVSVVGGYFIYRLAMRFVRMEERRAAVFSAAFAGWVGTVLASVSCAGQLALSGTAPWRVVFPAMANLHILIGLGEGLATGMIVLAVMRSRPDLLTDDLEQGRVARLSFAGYGLLIAIGLTIFIAPFACPWPDGLESVAAKLGFEHEASGSPVAAPWADYQIPFIGSPIGATAAAGVVGTMIAFAGAYLLARALVPAIGTSRKNAPSEA